MAAASAGDPMIAGQPREFEREPEFEKAQDALEFRGDFGEAGQSPLWSELERIYRRVERGVEDTENFSRAARPGGPSIALPEQWDPVGKLRELFGLSGFEMDILL